jgi:outer membrane protein assembly factor BamA
MERIDESSRFKKLLSDQREIDDRLRKLLTKLNEGNEEELVLTVDELIEKLNVIRGGKSFKDQQVLAQLTSYFDKLKDAEKKALIGFLEGIAQIATGQVETNNLTNVVDTNVQIKDGDKQNVISIKPTIIKKLPNQPIPSAPKTKVEDTSAPVPITPVKK